MGGDLSTPIVVLIDGPLLPWIRSGTDNEQDALAEIDFFITQMAPPRSPGHPDRLHRPAAEMCCASWN